MTFTDHFIASDTQIGPQPWMQLRQIATGSAASVSKTYDPNDGWPKNETLQSVTVAWTNDTPVGQMVYGLVSKSGSQVTLQCRSRGYLSTGHALNVGGPNPSLTLTEVSRFGVGTDLGNGGILNIGGAFGISELRQNSATIPLMPHVTQWFLVGPGETITAQVQVKFVSEWWENTVIDGGSGDTESKVITGDLRVDLFTVPSVLLPTGRTVPTLVGGASNVKSDVKIALGTAVTKPSGLQVGDILVAVVCNNQSILGAVGPLQSGWTLLHNRRVSLLGGDADVHMKVYVKTVTGSEPAEYTFSNSLLAEQHAVVFGIRGADPYQDSYGSGWYVASNLSSYKFVEEQIAPSIEQPGQLLLAFSFFAHTNLQAPITQTVPSGMTEILDLPGSGQTLSIAMLSSPPTPTLDRQFTPSVTPMFSGHSITASMLIPGTRTYA